MFSYFYLPESKRWSDLNENPAVEISEDSNHTTGQFEFFNQLFRSKMYLKRLFFSFFIWTAAGVIYYGFAMNLGSLSGSIYINSSINGVIEIFGSVVFPLVFMNSLGRINTLLVVLGAMMLMAICGLMITNPQLINVVRWTGALAVAHYMSWCIHTHQSVSQQCSEVNSWQFLTVYPKYRCVSLPFWDCCISIIVRITGWLIYQLLVRRWLRVCFCQKQKPFILIVKRIVESRRVWLIFDVFEIK